MTFIPVVERWRPTVQSQVADLLATYPSRAALLVTVGMTVDELVDTILAIIQKESTGDPSATGDSGNSIGLMMLNFGAGTPQGQGYRGDKAGLFDPTTNIYYGSKYFLDRLNEYGDRDTAILAYNAGSLLTKADGTPVNQSYLDVVLSFLGEKKTLYSRPPRSGSSSTPPPKVFGGVAPPPAAPVPGASTAPVGELHPARVFSFVMLLTALSQFVKC